MEQTTLKSPQIQTTVGYKNTLIQDLLNQDFYIVSNEEDINLFFQEFKEFVFQVPENLAHCFSDIKFEYFNLNLIDNVILKYNKEVDYSVLKQVLNTVQLIIYADKIENKDDFLKLLDDFNGQIISILIDNQKLNLSEKDLHMILGVHYNVLDLFIISSFSIEGIKAINQTTIYYFSEHEYDKKASCDKRISSFRSNLQLYTESQSRNTYFNRKLYIGYMGEIKNSSDATNIFGYIAELETADSLKKIIESSNFQSYWFVNKNVCDICKDCEFKHVCVDSRIPYQRSGDEWYHKAECNYNPYICKWKGEEGHQTLAECGVITNEDEFYIDHDKIGEINQQLWSE